MKAIRFEKTDKKFLISLDKSYFDKETLLNLLERFRIEYLAKKADFDDSIIELGEQIKDKWWENNKNNYLSRDK
ncbi:MAG: hypothetical protein KAT68_03185 [Bacteroidales bacterium]|nr:hypothetical protein [Bacteroidales bacterium]